MFYFISSKKWVLVEKYLEIFLDNGVPSVDFRAGHLGRVINWAGSTLELGSSPLEYRNWWA